MRRDVEALVARAESTPSFLETPVYAAVSLIGRQLGAYRLEQRIGAGGMGEVYQAKDTRLGRDVAVKILSAARARDPHRRARFEREARAVAALNHPNICTIHDVGHDQGIDFLVMELIDGESLATRLARGPLPLDQALAHAIEIADALDKAHRQGIIHRDLKPGNVMLTKTGSGTSRVPHAKLLDFGLARIMSPPVGAGATTQTHTAGMTDAGAVLGTLQYMAPEQLEGRPPDARTDIFAFGTLLYEMLSGRPAFKGASSPALIAAILRDDAPSFGFMEPPPPTALEWLVRTSLAKDPDNRFSTMHDVLLELQWIQEAGVRASEQLSLPAPGGVRGRIIAAVVAAFLVMSGLVAGRAYWKQVPAPAPLRLVAELGVDASIDNDPGGALALSPDGALLAFVAQRDEKARPQLYLRRLDQLQAISLAGTEDAVSPFFSPDGAWIAFFAGRKLRKISVSGGASVTLCDAPNARGGTWTEDDTIIFNPDVPPGVSLMRVSSAGGKAEPFTTITEGEVTHRWPQVLPGGRALLYTSHTGIVGFDAANVIAKPLPSGTPKVVLRGGYYGRFLGGHLVYIYKGTLFAAPFDLDRLEVTGQPVPVVTGVDAISRSGGANFASSTNGTLVYLPGRGVVDELPLDWLDASGKTTPLRATPANWSNVRFAPDGRRLAMDINDGRQSDVWIYEWEGDRLSRLTLDANLDEKPVWTTDGQRIAFASGRGTSPVFNLYWQRADGTGEVQRLTDSANPQWPNSWHPSGKFLAFSEQTLRTNEDILILPLEGDERSGWKAGKATVFANGPSLEREPMFSPDGRWLAYVSNESGRSEVYVRPFSGSRGAWMISIGGGSTPTWSQTRHELFYESPDHRIMVVPYSAEDDAFRPEKPRLWSERRFRRVSGPTPRSFDLHPDGNRVALAVAPEAQTEAKRDRLVFIFNFVDELRRIGPNRK